MSIARKITEGAGGGGSGGSSKYVDDVFSTYLYEGTGANRDIVNGIDLDDKGGLVWLKNRTASGPHYLFDTERGPNYRIYSNLSNSQVQGSQTLEAFNNNGFSLGSGDVTIPGDWTSWTFRKAPGFFDVVTYTGDGVAGREIPHNLGSVPGMIIIKKTSGTSSWYCWHKNYTGAGLYLNNNAVYPGDTSAFATSQSSTTFNLMSGVQLTANSLNNEYVAYLFAHDAPMFGPNGDESIIKCGSYVGNGVPIDGPVIDLGWEPQWVMIKAINPSSTGSCDWVIFDSMRGLTASYPDVLDPPLAANTSADESTNLSTGKDIAPLANGFQITNNGGRVVNESGTTYIYMAIRRPMKPAEEFEPDELFAVAAGITSAEPGFTSGFPVDMAWQRPISSTAETYLGARLIQREYIRTDSSNPAYESNSFTFDYMDGWLLASDPPEKSWMFRRAPGFFDVVTYKGDGVIGRQLPHNLGVAPEMIWIKTLDVAAGWSVYAEPTGYSTTGRLDSDKAFESSNVLSAAPTASNIILGGGDSSNYPNGWKYIAYLWVSVPGICDIGSYTGTGALQDIDCGFTNGSRFVLVKRADDTGDWQYWDTLRGIVSGASPYLALNNADAQADGYRVYPLAEGFQISDDPRVNASGGEYIYMAIA